MTEAEARRLLDTAIKAYGTRAAFAKKVKLSPGYVSDVMNGRRNIPDKLLKVVGLKRDIVVIANG